MNIFTDIETLPTESNQEIAFVADNMKPPGNYKKQDAIDRWMKDNRQEAVKKTALSGLFGRVYMIGYAIGNESPQVIREESEVETLVNFKSLLVETGAIDQTGRIQATFVGHNLIDFDLPFLSQRMMINGLGPLWPHDFKVPAKDTMKMFSCGRYKQYYSLDALCLAFGVDSPKSELDGSKVHDYYLAGRHDEVVKYCADDVEATRAVYQAMTMQRAA